MATGAERCGYVQSYALSGFRDGLSPARTRLAHKGLAVPPWSKRYRVGMNNLSLNRRSLALGAVALPLAAQEPEKEPQGGLAMTQVPAGQSIRTCFLRFSLFHA